MEHATLWIKIDPGDRGPINPGKIALLRRIRDDRSISAAARDAHARSMRVTAALPQLLNNIVGHPYTGH